MEAFTTTQKINQFTCGVKMDIIIIDGGGDSLHRMNQFTGVT